MCYAYSCRKAQRKPLHEMLSMKLPAEAFLSLCQLRKKQEQKRQETVFFASRDWGNAKKKKNRLKREQTKM